MNPEREKIMADARREATLHKRKIILRRAGIWGGAVFALTAMVWGLAMLASSPSGGVSSGGTLSDPINPSVDHIKGNPDAKVTLVEYSDFQCPACASIYPSLKNLISKSGENMRIVYRHFPLPQHDKSDLAARAGESAAMQGKFWEMHDKLFDGQSLWTNKSEAEATQLFGEYAEQIGIDKAKFLLSLNLPSVSAAIARDLDSGRKSGVNGTPSLFLNDKQLPNLASYGDLETYVERAINEAK